MRTTLNGLPWEADPLDWLDIEVLRFGTYEPEITKRLLLLVRDDDVMWDIGANAGVHAITVKVRRPSVRVVAVEPSPLRYARLVQNAALNGADILSYCIGVADSPGYRTLSVADARNSGHTSLIPWQDVRYGSTMPCWCDTVDRLCQLNSLQPNVVKIDVEGAEELVLRGMEAVLAAPALRDVIFEAPGDLLTSDGPVTRILSDGGFGVDPLPAGGGGINYHAHRRQGRG